jgi:hypothetical protein
MVSAIGFPLIGLMGAWFGWRQADAGTRPLWLNYAALLAAAALVTILVQRAGAVANALAVIGTVALLMPLLQRTQASANILVRVLGTAFAILALAPPTLALTYVGFAGNGQKGGEVKDRACSTTENYRLLNALPPSRLMTNIDIGPGVLHETRSTIVASGHHRNQMGIKDTMLTFIRGDEAARAILLKHRIDYIVVCPDMVEMDVYSGYGPDGLWSHLRKGKTPPWLKPASIPHNPGFAIWKVEP